MTKEREEKMTIQEALRKNNLTKVRKPKWPLTPRAIKGLRIEIKTGYLVSVVK